MTNVTPASLTALLSRDDLRPHVIGRALVVLFEHQTTSEKASNSTKITNNVGFTQADARSGTITAKYYLKHKTLLAWQMDRWMKPARNGTPRIVKYWRQLNAAAAAKAAAKSIDGAAVLSNILNG